MPPPPPVPGSFFGASGGGATGGGAAVVVTGVGIGAGGAGVEQDITTSSDGAAGGGEGKTSRWGGGGDAKVTEVAAEETRKRTPPKRTAAVATTAAMKHSRLPGAKTPVATGNADATPWSRLRSALREDAAAAATPVTERALDNERNMTHPLLNITAAADVTTADASGNVHVDQPVAAAMTSAPTVEGLVSVSAAGPEIMVRAVRVPPPGMQGAPPYTYGVSTLFPHTVPPYRYAPMLASSLSCYKPRMRSHGS